MSKNYIRIKDGTIWPNPKNLEHIEHRLRYESPILCREELLKLASVVSAYRNLIVRFNLAESNRKISMIRKVLHLYRERKIENE